MRNIITNQPSRKLDYKILGFFKIIENKRVSIEFQLLQSIKINNVIYPNLH